ncbi:MAG: hypothetical protein IPL79_09945 [Myxococcales bacterium]|nr:hypothetical protein [Myxococcales bacterium]
MREVVAQALASKARANRFVLSADGNEIQTPSRMYSLSVVQGSVWLVVAKRQYQ